MENTEHSLAPSIALSLSIPLYETHPRFSLPLSLSLSLSPYIPLETRHLSPQAKNLYSEGFWVHIVVTH